MTLGIGGAATADHTSTVKALPEPVVYTGVEYDGTGDAAERALRFQIERAARDAAVARAAVAVKTRVSTATGGSSQGNDNKKAAGVRPVNDGGGSAGSSTKPPTSSGGSQPASGRAATVVAFARAQVGKRYVFATSGPNTFDCSGLVVAAYRKIGISLPHQTGGLSGRGRSVSRSQLQPGDLVFPHSGHVGIYVGGGMMVHASNSKPYPQGGVKLSTVYQFSYARRIL